MFSFLFCRRRSSAPLAGELDNERDFGVHAAGPVLVASRHEFPLRNGVADDSIEDGIARRHSSDSHIARLADSDFRADGNLRRVFQINAKLVGNRGVNARLQAG